MKYAHELVFHGRSKHIKRVHVEGEVNYVCMNKATGKETIVLPVVGNSRGIEDKIIQDLFIAECRHGYKNGYDNDD